MKDILNTNLNLLLKKPHEATNVDMFFTEHYSKYYIPQETLTVEELRPNFVRALSLVHSFTFYRIKEDTLKDDEYLLNSVLDCICELSEYITSESKLAKDIGRQLEGMKVDDLITGESIDGASITKVNPLEAAKFSINYKRENTSKVQEIIFRHLGNTGLMYRGWYRDEKST